MVKTSSAKKRKMEDFHNRKRAAVETKKRKRSSEANVVVNDDLRRLLSGRDEPVGANAPKKDLRQLLSVKEDSAPQSGPSRNDLRELLRGKEATNGGVDDGRIADTGALLNGNSVQGNGKKIDKDVRNLTAPNASPTLFKQWSKAISQEHAKKIKLTVLLENANLETVQSNGRAGGVSLLNCDDHRHILKKSGREANDARPDITHQCLLALQDSPLNKAGHLKVYVRTSKKVLIDIHPQTRIPRTIKRFSGLMAELLEKYKVRSTGASVPLLKVIRNPITSHLPVGARKIVCTYNTENVVDIREHASRMAELALPRQTGDSLDSPTEYDIKDRGEEVNVVYVIGAMAHGKITEDWADDNICVSEYPLSAATVCSRITYAYETLLGIL